jgi:hypothetical protein
MGFSFDIRERVARRQHYRCAGCGRHFGHSDGLGFHIVHPDGTPPEQVQGHHVEHKSAEGKDTEDNCVMVCHPFCHGGAAHQGFAYSVKSFGFNRTDYRYANLR